VLACDDGKDSDTEPADDSGTTIGLDSDQDGVENDNDCAPDDATIYPGAEEICDGVDNDCDPATVEDTTTYYEDADGDGYGDAGSTAEACGPTAGWTENSDDCNDDDGSINPDATELCDEVDNDCDDQIDEGVSDAIWYYDGDDDGYGDPDNYTEDCTQPEGYVDNSWDCDDSDELEPVHVSEDGYVDTGVWDSGSGWGTDDAPYGSIQDGIYAARACVMVHPGEYWEDVDFSGKDVAVVGVDGADNTFIYGTGNGPVVTFAQGESSDASLSGFTIQGGGGELVTDVEESDIGSGVISYSYWNTYRGGGIYIDGANPTLMDLVITENYLPDYSTSESGNDITYTTSEGGGIYVSNANPEMWWNLQITSNSADIGGGVYVAGDGSAADFGWAWIASNSASAGGGIYTAGAVTLENSVMASNTSDGSNGNPGGAAADVAGSEGMLSLLNVALYANDGIASVYAWDESSVAIGNSIIDSNDDGYCLDGSDASLSITYSDVYNCSSGGYGDWTDMTGSNGNLDSDPLFVDASGGDFSLRPTSPGVDAGDPDASFNDVDGSRNDMGAYGGPGGEW
jgi:hypothetical protein